ncbi:UNVERIFIED_CONTAM: hypothetical protein HDU68_009822, partial [Siphonaria sp. JEL0065]
MAATFTKPATEFVTDTVTYSIATLSRNNKLAPTFHSTTKTEIPSSIPVTESASPILYVVSVGAAVLILGLAGFALYIRKTNRNDGAGGGEPDHEIQMDDLEEVVKRSSLQNSP